ncbi:hypothetical protein AQUCO_07900003v1 [Aquilegia coerulea]|uniref:TTF-type domain-containing protein n=1 Tax=Aquilegia coerulea TaxID=218851 RepID=A0A2G5C7U5_AQUCA|nr:hypothetical protein AQUCO_07900003v1 [Aquilegia coerulea]
MMYNLPGARAPEINASNLPSDPNLRPKFFDYHPNDQNVVQRAYLLRGPNQPRQEVYPPTPDRTKLRRFKLKYYKQYGNWLEYSIDKDAIFCLHCYLWRDEYGDHREAFINGRFRNWKNIKRIDDHVGDHNSGHNQACLKSENLMKQEQHIETILVKQSDQERIDYRIHLTVSLDCILFLLRQGLAFRGHDESENSKNRGNFLEFFKFLASHNEKVDSVSLKNAPQNNLLTSPDIQKDLVNSCVVETVNVIMKDLGEELFVVHLRHHLGEFFGKHALSFMRLRGQGYDGPSNIQGQFNGLKALILNENKSAIYVHCFAHQLQLALVHVAKDIKEIASFFTSVSNIVNVVGVSCKRRDNLRNKQAAKVFMQFKSGELSSGRGLNQEIGLKRPSDTRWGSHYGTLVNFIVIFSSVVEVLDEVMEESSSSDKKGETQVLLDLMHSFEFCFILHLMRNLLGIINDLSKALQRKDQNIVNALALVKVCKERLQQMREGGWDSLFVDVSSFCGKHGIDVPQMEAKFNHLEFFYGCIDKQRVELDNRFDKVNTELLLCMACLNPNNSFSAFDVEKLIRLAEFYPDDFSEQERMVLRNQLETYGIDMKYNNTFATLKGISSLATTMVERGKNITYDLVYRLIKLSLILPVSTATVERSFSVMNIVKNRLRNQMGDE